MSDTIPRSLLLHSREEIIQTEEGNRGARGTLGTPEVSKSAPDASSEFSGIIPSGMSSQARWVLLLRNKTPFKVVLLSAVAWCPDNRRARRYILMSSVTGKIQEGKCQHLDINGNGKIFKKIKKMYFGANRAEVS